MRFGAPVGLLAAGLPLATTLAVGLVAYHVVPDLTLPAALVLGAIVAPPDAVSATAIGRRLGLPRRMMTLLGGAGSFFGPFIGALAFLVMEDMFSIWTSHWQIIVGSVFVLFVLFLPKGIWGTLMAWRGAK